MTTQLVAEVSTVDVYNVSLVQQCRMLEAETNTNILAMCLNNPTDALITMKSAKRRH